MAPVPDSVFYAANLDIWPGIVPTAALEERWDKISERLALVASIWFLHALRSIMLLRPALSPTVALLISMRPSPQQQQQNSVEHGPRKTKITAFWTVARRALAPPSKLSR